LSIAAADIGTAARSVAPAKTGESRLNEDAVPRLPPASASAPQRTKAGIIEIELGGRCVRVDRDVDAEALQQVL